MEDLKSGYASVDSIVMSVIADLGEGGTHNYDRYLHYALRGCQDWHMDSAQEIITKCIPMNAYNAIDFPVDYLDWVKIGIQVGDRVKTFGVNDNLAVLHNLDECGNPITNQSHDCNCIPDSIGGDLGYYGGYYFDNYINEYGEHLGRFFGVGGGSIGIGHYKVNKEKKQIQFEGKVHKTNVYLEYISNGFDPCADTMVNRYAESLIRTYIHWQRAIFKFGKASGEAASWEEEYYTQLRLSRARVFDLTIKDILDASRKEYKLSIKN